MGLGICQLWRKSNDAEESIRKSYLERRWGRCECEDAEEEVLTNEVIFQEKDYVLERHLHGGATRLPTNALLVISSYCEHCYKTRQVDYREATSLSPILRPGPRVLRGPMKGWKGARSFLKEKTQRTLRVYLAS